MAKSCMFESHISHCSHGQAACCGAGVNAAGWHEEYLCCWSLAEETDGYRRVAL